MPGESYGRPARPPGSGPAIRRCGVPGFVPDPPGSSCSMAPPSGLRRPGTRWKVIEVVVWSARARPALLADRETCCSACLPTVPLFTSRRLRRHSRSAHLRSWAWQPPGAETFGGVAGSVQLLQRPCACSQVARHVGRGDEGEHSVTTGSARITGGAPGSGVPKGVRLMAAASMAWGRAGWPLALPWPCCTGRRRGHRGGVLPRRQEGDPAWSIAGCCRWPSTSWTSRGLVGAWPAGWTNWKALACAGRCGCSRRRPLTALPTTPTAAADGAAELGYQDPLNPAGQALVEGDAWTRRRRPGAGPTQPAASPWRPGLLGDSRGLHEVERPVRSPRCCSMRSRLSRLGLQRIHPLLQAGQFARDRRAACCCWAAALLAAERRDTPPATASAVPATTAVMRDGSASARTSTMRRRIIISPVQASTMAGLLKAASTSSTTCPYADRRRGCRGPDSRDRIPQWLRAFVLVGDHRRG